MTIQESFAEAPTVFTVPENYYMRCIQCQGDWGLVSVLIFLEILVGSDTGR